jgi:hypothetical protein
MNVLIPSVLKNIKTFCCNANYTFNLLCSGCKRDYSWDITDLDNFLHSTLYASSTVKTDNKNKNKCAFCGILFVARSKAVRCCSPSCRHKDGVYGRRVYNRLRNSASGIPPLDEKPCDFCGKSFIPRNKMNRCCSIICTYQDKRYQRKIRKSLSK